MLSKEYEHLMPVPVTGRKVHSKYWTMQACLAKRICFLLAVLVGLLLVFRRYHGGTSRPSLFSSLVPVSNTGVQESTDSVTATAAALDIQLQDVDISHFGSGSSSNRPLPQSPEGDTFWSSFAKILADGKPSFPEVRRKGGDGLWIFFDRHHQQYERPDLLNLSDIDYTELQTLRTGAIAAINEISSQLPYNPGTRGIVTTAPKDAFGMLTTSLWMLRKTGSSLPVEIWLYDREQSEKEPCDVIFPSLNAKCMFMVDYLPTAMATPLEIVKFTYKPLSMVFSTFEQFIFLDDDVFPTANPDSLFESEPFLSKGMILWPDFWADTASADLYQLSGLPIPDMKAEASTESGEMIVNKATHGSALLLATWFNTYGPQYWHRLASQNSPGEGDKDLWRFAIQAFDLPWYQVEERPQRVGYYCEGKSHPIGSAHSHPNDDFKIFSAGMMRDHDEWVNLGTSTHPRIIFIHANLPKLDPYLLLDWHTVTPGWNNALRCDDGKGAAHRLYGPPDLTVPRYGWDIEMAIWNAFVWMSCEHERAFSVWTTVSWWRPEPRTDLCKQVQSLWDELFPGESWDRNPPDPAKSEKGQAWGEHTWT